MAALMKINENYTISALSNRFGLSLRTLRFYEERGLLCPQRQGAHRIYSERDVVKIQIIILAKRFGFTISEVKDLIASRESENLSADNAYDLNLSVEEIEKRTELLTRQKNELDRAISELKTSSSLKNLVSRGSD